MSFRFKQFYIEDSKCAMKVGTDGVLLGAWARYKGPSTKYHVPFTKDHVPFILDVGTGSGLVALMLAQRFPEAKVHGIDIDETAVEQAAENFRLSPWSERLQAFACRVQEWQAAGDESGCRYDLVVSNPPYFQNSLKNPDAGRQTARHTDTLSYEELVRHSVRLLKEEGELALILPAEAENEMRAIAAAAGLTLTHVTRVYSKESRPPKRVLMAFRKGTKDKGQGTKDKGQGTKDKGQGTKDSLVLEDDKGGRSEAYQEMAKDFYL